MQTRYTRNRSGNHSNMTAADITAAYMDAREDELLDAAVTAAALVARSDGTVEPIERSEMLDVLRRNGLLSVFTRFDILAAFDSRLRQLEEDEGMEAAVDCLGRLAGRSPAWLVVETAERVAAADRHVNGRELQMLRLIHLALTRPPAPQRARTAGACSGESLPRTGSGVAAGSPTRTCAK